MHHGDCGIYLSHSFEDGDSSHSLDPDKPLVGDEEAVGDAYEDVCDVILCEISVEDLTSISFMGKKEVFGMEIMIGESFVLAMFERKLYWMTPISVWIHRLMLVLSMGGALWLEIVKYPWVSTFRIRQHERLLRVDI